MNNSKLVLSLIFISLFFTACEVDSIFGPSKKELELQQAKLDLQKQKLQFNQLLAQKKLDQQYLLNLKQSDAKIANDIEVNKDKKELELAKIDSQIKKDKLLLDKYQIEVNAKEKDLQFDLAKQKNDNSLSSQKYIIAVASFLVIVFTFALFTYYNNRRKDKLRAYQDNLDKYFKEKENKAKVEIASKILDTIASGRLNAEQESRLISSLGSDSKSSDTTLLQNANKSSKVDIIHDIDDVRNNTKH